jgi:hypothetical protein
MPTLQRPVDSGGASECLKSLVFAYFLWFFAEVIADF